MFITGPCNLGINDTKNRCMWTLTSPLVQSTSINCSDTCAVPACAHTFPWQNHTSCMFSFSWFSFVRSALLLAVFLCWVGRCCGSCLLLGLFCHLRVTHIQLRVRIWSGAEERRTWPVGQDRKYAPEPLRPGGRVCVGSGIFHCRGT